jgi:two-component system, chemotaxis family, chemotaxis protein CheY
MMQTYSPDKDFAKFLFLIASRKREFKNWLFMHVYLDHGSTETLPVDEMVQFSSFYFQKNKPDMLHLPASSEFLLITTKDNIANLMKFEKAIREQFPTGQICLETRSFDQIGFDTLIKIITPHIRTTDNILLTQFRRLKRLGNMLMVLDDDTMVTKQLEKVLTGYGYVIALNKTEKFFEQYVEYAPDVLFLDIHLGDALGNVLLRELKEKIDPNAHVVMISSDTEEKTILDIKHGGAKGFIVKPFNQNNLFQHLSKVPTFVFRSDKA